MAVFTVSFFVLNWLYGYVIEFQSATNDCFFLSGRPFLSEFLDHPAGPLRYAARFLGQFYYHRWLGAVIVYLDSGSRPELLARTPGRRP